MCVCMYGQNIGPGRYDPEVTAQEHRHMEKELIFCIYTHIYICIIYVYIILFDAHIYVCVYVCMDRILGLADMILR
jgi:hypothetical protein